MRGDDDFATEEEKIRTAPPDRIVEPRGWNPDYLSAVLYYFTKWTRDVRESGGVNAAGLWLVFQEEKPEYDPNEHLITRAAMYKLYLDQYISFPGDDMSKQLWVGVRARLQDTDREAEFRDINHAAILLEFWEDVVNATTPPLNGESVEEYLDRSSTIRRQAFLARHSDGFRLAERQAPVEEPKGKKKKCIICSQYKH